MARNSQQSVSAATEPAALPSPPNDFVPVSEAAPRKYGPADLAVWLRGAMGVTAFSDGRCQKVREGTARAEYVLRTSERIYVLQADFVAQSFGVKVTGLGPAGVGVIAGAPIIEGMLGPEIVDRALVAICVHELVYAPGALATRRSVEGL